jgi:hypothetical protein
MYDGRGGRVVDRGDHELLIERDLCSQLNKRLSSSEGWSHDEADNGKVEDLVAIARALD